MIDCWLTVLLTDWWMTPTHSSPNHLLPKPHPTPLTLMNVGVDRYSIRLDIGLKDQASIAPFWKTALSCADAGARGPQGRHTPSYTRSSGRRGLRGQVRQGRCRAHCCTLVLGLNPLVLGAISLQRPQLLSFCYSYWTICA